MKKAKPPVKKTMSTLAADLPAALVVYLVALPLCLGIALGSDAEAFSGIIAGTVGGIVVGFLSGSSLSVSGPAAGLTTIVAAALGKVSFEAFLLAVAMAGVIQIIFGFIKAGVLGEYVPVSVIKGMLAAIGIILILKQLPHLVGYDHDFEGDEAFFQPDGENTFTEIFQAFRHFTPGAVFIGAISIAILILWETKPMRRIKVLQYVPGALIVVILGTVINEWFLWNKPEMVLSTDHLVNIPVAHSFNEFTSYLKFPDLTQIVNGQVWITALTIALVASLETLLGLEAVDKLDPQKRVSPPNRELIAQGAGNITCGLLGGLPITSVVVRSSANVNAGGQSKISTIVHGIMLLISVYFFPELLNKIPNSALAGVLIFVGFKLTKPALIKEMYHKGWDVFVPFAVTIVAILFTDLLKGIGVGILVGLFYVVRSNYRTSIRMVQDGNNYLIRFKTEVSFLNKPVLKNMLSQIPDHSQLLIDASKTHFIDYDIVEIINNFICQAEIRNIMVTIKEDVDDPKSRFNLTKRVTHEKY